MSVYLGLRSVSFSDFFAYVPKFALIVSSDDFTEKFTFTEKFIMKFGKSLSEVDELGKKIRYPFLP